MRAVIVQTYVDAINKIQGDYDIAILHSGHVIPEEVTGHTSPDSEFCHVYALSHNAEPIRQLGTVIQDSDGIVTILVTEQTPEQVLGTIQQLVQT